MSCRLTQPPHRTMLGPWQEPCVPDLRSHSVPAYFLRRRYNVKSQIYAELVGIALSLLAKTFQICPGTQSQAMTPPQTVSTL